MRFLPFFRKVCHFRQLSPAFEKAYWPCTVADVPGWGTWCICACWNECGRKGDWRGAMLWRVSVASCRRTWRPRYTRCRHEPRHRPTACNSPLATVYHTSHTTPSDRWKYVKMFARILPETSAKRACYEYLNRDWA